jgi:hypothetical protein
MAMSGKRIDLGGYEQAVRFEDRPSGSEATI